MSSKVLQDLFPNIDDIDEFAAALLIASRVLVHISVRSLPEHITLPQFRTLVILDSRGPMNLSALAAILGVNSSTAMRMIDRLIILGKVTRHDRPDNRREVVIELTARGKRIVRQATDKRRREIQRVVQRMAPDNRDNLITALNEFSKAADEPLQPIHESQW